MTQYHEPPEELGPQDRDIVRAWVSLKEEIEAIYWYHQRAVTCSDPELRKILLYNRDEEMEHATLALEWLRRLMPELDAKLRATLFTTESVVETAEQAEATGSRSERPSGDLGIGTAL